MVNDGTPAVKGFDPRPQPVSGRNFPIERCAAASQAATSADSGGILYDTEAAQRELQVTGPKPLVI